ncbi:MAG: glycosyltransferase [Bryobacterales bacterium]|nr:glycosyltransferase [Bryobacterales bacterium]
MNLLRGLCERHRVTLLSFRGAREGEACAALPAPAPEEVRVCRYREFNPRSVRSLAGFFSTAPRSLVYTHSSEMEGLIRQAVGKTQFDLVIASQLSMGAYYRAFRGIPAILEEEELAMYCPWACGADSLHNSFRHRLAWAKHRSYLGRLLRHFRACTVASEAERRLLAAAVPHYQSVHVIPNTIDLSLFPAPAKERVQDSLIFSGPMSYRPNYDAVLWFLREVYPAVKSEIPGARLTVTGDPGSFPRPADPDVVFTGWVDDVRPLVGRSAVSIVPIRQGGGTRLKILEAMALGTPVVTTSKGAEGLDGSDGIHLRIADDPRAFARCVAALLRDAQERERLAENAYSLVRAQYDSRVVVPRFLRLVESAGAYGGKGMQSVSLEEPNTGHLTEAQ